MLVIERLLYPTQLPCAALRVLLEVTGSRVNQNSETTFQAQERSPTSGSVLGVLQSLETHSR